MQLRNKAWRGDWRIWAAALAAGFLLWARLVREPDQAATETAKQVAAAEEPGEVGQVARKIEQGSQFGRLQRAPREVDWNRAVPAARAEELEDDATTASGSVFRGRVLDADTRASVREFRVHVLAPNPPAELLDIGKRKLKSDDGRFAIRFPPDASALHATVEVVVDAEGYEPASDFKLSSGLEATLFGEATKTTASMEQVFMMQRGTRRTYRIIDSATSRPLTGVPVQVMMTGRMGGAMKVGSFAEVNPMTCRRLYVSDEAGEFVDYGPPAAQRFLIDEPPYERLMRGPIELLEMTTDSEGKFIIPIGTGCILAGRLSLAGRPVVAQIVELAFQGMGEYSPGSGYKWRDIKQQTNADGRFSWDRLPAGRYRLVVSESAQFPYSLKRNVELSPGKSQFVELNQEAGSLTLSGRVHRDEEPVKGVEIKLVDMTSGSGVVYSATSGSDGNYRIERVKPGSYSFHAQLNRKDAVVFLREQIELAGDLCRDIEASAKHRVRIGLEYGADSPVENRPVFTRATLLALHNRDNSAQAELQTEFNVDYSAEGRRAQDGADDSWIFDGRLVGDYELTLKGDRELTIPGTMPLDNLDGDMDYGTIRLPTGKIEVEFIWADDDGLRPDRINLSWNHEASGSWNNLEVASDRAVIGHLAAGKYQLMTNDKHFMDEERQEIEVREGEATQVSFVMQPAVKLVGRILENGIQTVTVARRITVTGPDVNQIQTIELPKRQPITAQLGYFSSVMTGLPNPMQGMHFNFGKLPPATYLVRVEAEGFQTWERQITPEEAMQGNIVVDLVPE